VVEIYNADPVSVNTEDMDVPPFKLLPGNATLLTVIEFEIVKPHALEGLTVKVG
jgi:hypothetical protein